MPYAAFSAGAIGNMIYCTLRATWPWRSGATCIAHAYRLINRSGRIRMCRLDVYIKPSAASVGAHANACRALRATVGNRRCTCQCISRAHSRHRQAQGAHANACRALRAAVGNRRCTCQCMPRAQSRRRQVAGATCQCMPPAQGRQRQAQVHMSTHAARSGPPSASEGAHANACRTSKPLSAIAGAHINACRALRAASGKRRCTYQRMPHAHTPPVEASAQHQLMPLIPSRRQPARQYLRSARPVSPRQLRTVFTIAKNPSVGT